MNIEIGVGLTGHYRVVKHKRGVGKVSEHSFDNIVLDVGWTALKDQLIAQNPFPFPKYLYLGTGTTEPDASDPGLESVSGTLAGKNYDSGSTVYVGNTTERYASVNLTFIYGEGEAEGTWTELGLAYGTSYTDPYNRSLFRDANGDPMSLTILSDEYLTVYVELRMYFPALGTTGSVDYNGQAVGYTIDYGSSPPFADYRYHSFWYKGCSSLSYNYAGTEVSLGTSGATMNYLGPDIVFETPGDSWDPGTSRSFDYIVFGSVHGSVLQWLKVTFDSPIEPPSDHKITVGKHTVTFTRGTVPA